MFNDYFKGKTALVTGAARGIGLTLCETLLKAEIAKVILVDINEENLNESVGRLNKEYPGKVSGMKVDVTKKDQVYAMIDNAEAQLGKLDILFNNAGGSLIGAFTDSPLTDAVYQLGFGDSATTDDSWYDVFNLNFFGALFAMKRVIPYMIKQGGGQIVNTISGLACTPFPFLSQYSSTKAALMGLSLSLRAEYAQCGIKINAVTPGTTATKIWQGHTPQGAQDPEVSVKNMLDAVVANKRLAYGDEGDVKGSFAFTEQAQDGTDMFMDQLVKNMLEKGEFIY